MFWLAVQGLVAPIAISSLVVLFTVSVVKIVIKAKGDDAMGSKVKEFVCVIFDILYTMSANLAGGALLAKTLQPELEQYILDNFDDQFKDIIGEEDVREVLNIIKEHFTVDWYKRNPILSKINMSITGYYFTKCQSRNVAKQKAEQIVALLKQMVEDFITAMDERGE